MQPLKNTRKKNIVDLLYKNLSYVIQGIAFEIRKDFGLGHKEQIYQKAFEEELKRHKVPYEREKSIKIYSPKDGKFIGLYRPDFIIDNKVILEIKTLQFVPKAEIRKIYDYLRNSEYELGYLINFASPKLYIKRIIFTNNKKSLFKDLLVPFSLFLVLISGLWLFSGLQAEAAELKLTAPVQTQEVAVGQQFQVDLLLDTENEEINAVEGKVSFPGELLEVKEIRDGNSIINFWIERPINPLIDTNINTNRHEINFSGIIPGGYVGEKGLIFSVVFQAKKEGEGEIEIIEAKTLLNDGKGTSANLSISNFQFPISEEAPAVPSMVETVKDTDPPEDFKPEIAQNSEMFGGKYFLVFATQDKSSGIDYYAIHETTRKKEVTRIDTKDWVEAESPYVLKDQNLRSYIYVKAIDKAGNERIAVVESRYPIKWYEVWWIWGIIILGIIIVYFVGKILWKE